MQDRSLLFNYLADALEERSVIFLTNLKDILCLVIKEVFSWANVSYYILGNIRQNPVFSVVAGMSLFPFCYFFFCCLYHVIMQVFFSLLLPRLIIVLSFAY